MYISKPTASMWPLCSPPSRLPAPRISRSSAATRNPLPRSLNSRIAASRFFATGDSVVLGRDQQVGVRRPVGPADAAAELVELRQPVAVGAVDDDRVGVRDVEAVLDDGGRQQHVELPRHEVEHRRARARPRPSGRGRRRAAPRARAAGRGSRSRRSTRPGCGRRRPGRRAPVSLRMARPITSESNFTTLVWIDSRSLGGVSMIDMSRMPTSDMFSVRGIGVAVIVSTSTLRLQLLELLLVRDAEALLLVDDQQPQVAERDVLRQQAVRADDDVDLAGAELLQRLLLLGLRPEAAHHVDVHREAGEALAQRLQVLERQHGRRRQERHLLAVHDRLEGGPHRDLGLAVADVAAEQAVHRRRDLHVALDVGDRRLLVRRQLVLEGVLELLLPVRVGSGRRGPATALRAA